MELHSSSSFEEGEAFPTTFNGGDDDHAVVDPDIALSYIDEKIQNLLGHYQKDFEGGVSAENLGAKFGGYGSFLPTYQRPPPRPLTKTPEINYKVSRSPVNLHMEAPSKNFASQSKTPSLGRPSTASCNTKSLNVKNLLPPDGAINRDTCLLSAQVAEKSPLKNENKHVNQNRKWQTKLRIKMGSDKFVKNNAAAVYTDLGLDDSPSSSGGDSPDICGIVPSTHHETSNESPTNILQEMTSFPVVGGLFLSPLHDDLLCLNTKDIHLSRLDSKMTVPDALKDKKTGIVAKVQRQKKNANDTGSMNASKVISSDNLKTTASEEKNSMSEKLKLTQPTNFSGGIGVSTIDTVREEANNNRLKGSPSSFHVAKEEPVKFYGRGNIEREGANNTPGYSHINMKRADQQNEVQSDIDTGMKDRKALDTGVSEPSKQLHLIEHRGINLSSGVGKELDRKKVKSNHMQNKDMQAANAVEKSMNLGPNTLPEDKCCINNDLHKPKSKRLRLKKQYNEDLTGDMKPRQIENMEKPLGMSTKSSNPDYSEKEYDPIFDQSEENLTCGGEAEQKSMLEVSLNEAPSGPVSEMVLPLAAPLVIQEDWVGCDSCEKWRLLPYGTNKDQLPKKWVCSMLNWLPGMNQCNISEDMTTDALRALYECPVPVIPGNGIKAVDETTLNNQISQPIGTKENKNCERKEHLSTDSTGGLVKVSNSTKNHHRESGKSRSSNGPNQIIEQATGQNESKHNKKSTRDDVEQANIKEKRKANQYNVGGSKRVKTENFGFEPNHNSQIDGGIKCVELSTMRTGRSMQKSAGVGSLKNATSLLKDQIYVPVKKEKDESPLSFGGEPSHLEVSDSNPLPKEDVNPKIVGSEFRKDTSTCISMGKVNASSSNNEKRRVPPIILSVNRGHRVDGIDKTTHKKNSEGQRCKNIVTPTPPTSNRKCGTEYATAGTTSSSSKVSGLRISKSRLQEVRDSPVESISSSPLRTFYTEQAAPERWENCKESDAGHGDKHMTGSDQGRCLDDEGIDKRKQDGTTRKENDFRFVHDESKENSTLDYREHANRNLDSKHKPCVDIQSSQPVVGDMDTIGHHVRSCIEHENGMNNKDGFRSDCDRSKGVDRQLNKPSSQNSCTALKEAEDLKALADSLKGSGFDDERRAAYFQATLKFLLAASLLETNNAERDGDISPPELYISTAKHCEMCALEYEGHEDIATAALLYKCIEVAYTRAVYCKHSTTTRDRDELQATLQMPPLVESPSSCVSDVDNLNHQSTAYKTTVLSKGSVPHSIAAGQVITSHNRPIINRLLDHTHHVILAMEASTKARNAFTAASVALREKHKNEGIDLLKRVVDFSFHDLEGFVRLVQLAMEAISRWGYNDEDQKKL